MIEYNHGSKVVYRADLSLTHLRILYNKVVLDLTLKNCNLEYHLIGKIFHLQTVYIGVASNTDIPQSAYP